MPAPNKEFQLQIKAKCGELCLSGISKFPYTVSYTMCTSIYQKRLSSLTMACMDESWVCLLLLLYCTAVTGKNYTSQIALSIHSCIYYVVSQDNCTHGSISLVGIETSITAAGYLKICINDTLWAVYDESWGEEEAAIVCRSLGFSPKGKS